MVEFQVRNLQDTPSLNPDMQGYAVRLSGFITHIGVAALMSWSHKHPRQYYSVILVQMAFIVLGTLIRSNDLSTVDVNFAILQTRSPVCMYIFLLVIPRLLFQGNARQWEEKATARKQRQDRIVSVLVLLVCLVLNLIRQFDASMFSASASANKTPLSDFFPGSLSIRQICTWIPLALCSAGVYSLVLRRHGPIRRELMHQLAGTRKIKFKTFPLQKRVLWGFCATWFIIMRMHPWLPILYATILFMNWSFEMNIWNVEMNYSFTFGQFLAIAPAFFILYQCIALFINRRHDIASLPHRLFLDVMWLSSGKGNPGWTEPGLELMLKDAWNTFPSDITQKAAELPLASCPGSLNVPQRRHLVSRCGKVRRMKELDIGEARPPYFQYIK